MFITRELINEYCEFSQAPQHVVVRFKKVKDTGIAIKDFQPESCICDKPDCPYLNSNHCPLFVHACP